MLPVKFETQKVIFQMQLLLLGFIFIDPGFILNISRINYLRTDARMINFDFRIIIARTKMEGKNR